MSEFMKRCNIYENKFKSNSELRGFFYFNLFKNDFNMIQSNNPKSSSHSVPHESSHSSMLHPQTRY